MSRNYGIATGSTAIEGANQPSSPHCAQDTPRGSQDGSLDVQDMTALVFALGIFVAPVILIGFTLMGWFLFIE